MGSRSSKTADNTRLVGATHPFHYYCQRKLLVNLPCSVESSFSRLTDAKTEASSRHETDSPKLQRARADYLFMVVNLTWSGMAPLLPSSLVITILGIQSP